VRENIIPDDVRMLGTFRYLDPDMRKDVHERVKRTAESIAASAGATAEATLEERVALTFNDPALTARMLPSLRRTAGDANVLEARPSLGGEDFSYYQQQIPGTFIWLGIRTPGASLDLFAQNHSPRFRIDESALKLGVRALARLAVDWLQTPWLQAPQAPR
jgi:metal-dependent amidase/aminoacylase/carboxypeptidase family protein